MDGRFEGNLIRQKTSADNVFPGSFGVNSEIVRSLFVDYIVVITESDYNALVNPDSKVLYLIVEG